MHFWIDKRSQCAYSGRHRVPSSLSAGVGRSRGRVCAAAGRKGMAAPVHRFAPVDCAPRRPRPLRHYGPPPMPAVHSARRQNDEASLYVEIPPEPPQPTIASLAAARSVTPDTLLRTAALGLHHSPMMAPHLKFGMLVSFALATVFLAGAKYYFDRHVSIVLKSVLPVPRLSHRSGPAAGAHGGRGGWGGGRGVRGRSVRVRRGLRAVAVPSPHRAAAVRAARPRLIHRATPAAALAHRHARARAGPGRQSGAHSARALGGGAAPLPHRGTAAGAISPSTGLPRAQLARAAPRRRAHHIGRRGRWGRQRGARRSAWRIPSR